MKSRALLAVACLVPTLAFAGGEYPNGGGAVNSPKAFSGSKALAGAIAGGGTAGAIAGGGSVTTSEDNLALGLGLSLVTSQGECPFLGSVNIAVVGFTYEIELCGVIQRIKMVQAAPLSPEAKGQAYMNLICTDPKIRASLSACVNR